MTKYCNQGKTNFGAKSRRKRFFGLALDTSIGLYRPVCKGLAEPELRNAQEVQVGGTRTGILITGKDEKRRRTVVQGKVLSISVKTLRHLKHHKEKEMLDREREDLRWRSVLSTICLPSVG